MSFPRYPKYKDSGVEWLGDVPVHWEIKRLKKNLKLITERTNDQSNLVALENILSWTGVFNQTESDFVGEGVVFKAGDILFGKLRPYLAKVYLATLSGQAIGDFHVMRPATAMNGRFVQYQMLSREFIDIVDGSTFGSKMPRASWEFVGGMQLTTPPLEEQNQIATFLDRETAKIDELIAEQQQLVALLKEKRQAVISHAVTKGLNPQTPMKPSGVEWLGDVPEHWEVKQLRKCSQVLRGKFTHRPRNDPAFYDGEHPFIQTGDVTGTNKYITDFKQTLNERGIAVSKQFPKGTLVMTIAANIGDVAILAFPAYFPDSIVGLIPQAETDLMFLFYLVTVLKQPLEKNATVSTQMNLNVEQISSVLAVLPPLNEQLEIVTMLDREVNKFDKLAVDASYAIDLLQERRKAMISAAVTGQVDLRGAV
jgi:type I restriction enzyme, S subunit